MEKEFKTYKEQIRLLKSKGLIIADEMHAIQTLKDLSYFALINGYKRPFKSDNGNYSEGACFEDIEQLYRFDESLRLFLLEQLLVVETRIKSSISYNFSQKYRTENAYLNVNNYNYSDNRTQAVNKLVTILQDIQTSTSHTYITHYKKNHNGIIPLWVLINAMTLGQVSKMYSLLKMGEQQSICGDFGISSQRDMEISLDILTLFRNVCAHNERLYDYKTHSQINKRYLMPYVNENINPDYNNTGKKLFGVLAFCAYILRDNSILERFRDLINSSPVINTPYLKDHLSEKMGLPVNWLEEK